MKTTSAREYNAALFARIRRLRDERDLTAEQMADALLISPDSYRKYETRTPMPHYLLERFAIITGCDIAFLVTGRNSPRRKRKDAPRLTA